jgi:DNA-binding NarL/FixJ family response regulator
MPLTHHILIADDHSIIRRGLKFILDAHFTGCYVNEADTIKEVKNLLDSFAFSHLIFDMQMLDDNIIEPLPEIRKLFKHLQKNPQSQLQIMMTTNGSWTDEFWYDVIQSFSNLHIQHFFIHSPMFYNTIKISI